MVPMSISMSLSCGIYTAGTKQEPQLTATLCIADRFKYTGTL